MNIGLLIPNHVYTDIIHCKRDNLLSQQPRDFTFPV